jgi:RNA polymerase sigma factor (sigma-70 family)
MDNSDHTRITLIERVQNQQDERSWAEFVAIYHGFIYGTVRRMRISPTDAEDVVQQVLLSLWQKLPHQDVHKIERFRSWVASMTKNTVIDFIRKRTSESTRWDKAAQDETTQYLKTIRLPDIQEIAEKQWKVYISNLAMDRIAPFFSGHAIAAFRLSLDGKSTAEVAQTLNIKEQSVYQLRNRVKHRLVQEIKILKMDLEDGGHPHE